MLMMGCLLVTRSLNISLNKFLLVTSDFDLKPLYIQSFLFSSPAIIPGTKYPTTPLDYGSFQNLTLQVPFPDVSTVEKKHFVTIIARENTDE